MSKELKVGAAIVLILASAIWLIAGVKDTQVGEKGNNGLNAPFPELSESTQKKMEEMRKNPDEMRKRFEGKDMTDPEVRKEAEAAFDMTLTEEEKAEVQKMRTQMQERMQKSRALLSPADQQALMRDMMQRFGGGRRGGGPRGGRGADGGSQE